jgi:alanine racemase
VAKGNGYGFGIDRLAHVADELGVDTVAVGTYAEVDSVLPHFPGSVLVLSPWRPFEARASYSDRLVHTVGRADVVASGLESRRVYVSHLTDDELATLREGYADFEIRPRIGTRLWLGDRAALTVRATVLDVHEVQRGDVFGYRGRSAPAHGHIVVVSGGTAHGVGLEAPTGGATIRDRAARLAKGGLDAAGFVRSPFTIGGKQRLFAEPPHMQASMLFLPGGAPPPAVGDEVDVRVRFTTTSADRIELV